MPTSSSNSMSWDFETADNTGTITYTANPVSAGSASYPVWLKGYWTNTVAYTVSNLKFWQFNPAASNVAVPTSANSTSSPGGPITFGAGGSFGTSAGNSGTHGTYLSLQLSAAGAAPAGTTGYFGFTMQYDEQ
jgi:hypothetical protein